MPVHWSVIISTIKTALMVPDMLLAHGNLQSSKQFLGMIQEVAEDSDHFQWQSGCRVPSWEGKSLVVWMSVDLCQLGSTRRNGPRYT